MLPPRLKKLRSMPEKEVAEEAAKLRSEIIDSVSRNGGHLASSCGCVELITALHRVFNTPEDKIFLSIMSICYVNNFMSTVATVPGAVTPQQRKQQDIGRNLPPGHHMLTIGKFFLGGAVFVFPSSLFCPKFHFRYFYHGHL